MSSAAVDAIDRKVFDAGWHRGRMLHDLLDQAVAERGESASVNDLRVRWTFRELAAHSHAVNAWLYVQGILPGDRVMVQAPSTTALTAVMFGVSRRGAVFVPIGRTMKPFQLRSVLDNAAPQMVVVADGDLEQTRELCPGIRVVGLSELWQQVEELCRQGVTGVPGVVTTEAPAAIVYTSGSTAAPKGVTLPHAQMVFATHSMNHVLGYGPDDVVFCRFPLSWDYGLYKVMLAVLGRAEIVLADAESDLRLVDQLRATGATIVPLVPSLATMICTLLARENGSLPPVRLFSNTGAALPAATIDRLREYFPEARVVRQFGQTECKRLTIMPPEQDRERPDSVGRPLPGTEVLILGPDGRRCPPGESGEIVAVGPHVMPGYWRSPELTARMFRRDPATGAARLHTGDYGRLDADGYLYFEGRRDDMFKRKGIRMSTMEIEAAALDVPSVRAAAVLPPHGDRDLMLFVEADVDGITVLREVARRLEAQKVPARCFVLAALPLTANGKNDRARLATLLEEGLS